MVPQIQTGYQPEFALGALYHGMNAANTQQSAEMELIKQFLANNREEQMQPMEVGMKGFDFAKQQALHENPNYLPQFVRGQIGEQVQKEMAGNEATRKDEMGNILHRFAKEQTPIEQDNKTRQLQMQNELTQIDQLLGNGGYDQFGNQATPEQMKMWGGLRQQIVDRMGQTPELSGKTALEHIKGVYDLEKARIAAEAALNAAKESSKNGGRPDWAMAINSSTSMINTLQKEISDLVANPLNDQISQILATRGLKKGTKEYEAALVTEKNKQLSALQAELVRQKQILQSIQYASGFGGMQPQVPTGQPTMDYVPGKGLVPRQ